MKGGRSLFIGGRARQARHDGAPRVRPPRGVPIHPRQQLTRSSSIFVRVPFLTRFSRAVLEVFRNSKWVMRHIFGNISTSSFQRYKFCANRSSDEGVMAPGSRGVGAVFVHFSDEDSGQTGDAIGEPRVPRRSWSCYLSNAPGLADQLVASRKDSAREGGSCAAYFCKVLDLRKSELGLVRYGPANRGHRSVFGPFEGSFPIGIPASPDQLVASQEDSARKRGNVDEKKFRNFQQNLIIHRPVFTRVVDVAPNVGFRRSWYRRKAYATYFSKEHAHTIRVNEKIDIYSFGVILLELTTGREANDGDEHTSLAQWAWRHIQKGNPIVDALDEEVKEPCYLDEMSCVFNHWNHMYQYTTI
uniref:Serine-threonine/tyrosine-protein kinase catalytic domain-containing protein n=1 Tax=Fagus sylvatica TaxID=28930 RepID=A0A2N9HST0_FAGSY